MGDRPRRSQPSPTDDAKPSALDATAERLNDREYFANILSEMQSSMQSNMQKAVDDRLADQRQAAADRLADQN